MRLFKNNEKSEMRSTVLLLRNEKPVHHSSEMRAWVLRQEQAQEEKNDNRNLFRPS